jgi:glucan 1,3-beta-glucosidase
LTISGSTLHFFHGPYNHNSSPVLENKIVRRWRRTLIHQIIQTTDTLRFTNYNRMTRFISIAVGIASVFSSVAAKPIAGEVQKRANYLMESSFAPEGIIAQYEGVDSISASPSSIASASVATGVPAAPDGPAASGVPAAPGSTTYWVSNIARNGAVAFGTAGYKVFRNVKDYGAKGDGSTDDTAAINAAIADGNRCGQNCDSSTVSPALIFFPAGTYVVSAPIVQFYYTQMVGDALKPPTLKAAPNFSGMAVIDADPYTNGANWYTNQNNFFRQVRNFVIDLTGITAKNGAGIHWQVAQGTSLQNIRFEMIKNAANSQSGIFMDNGSGGFMSDLTFNGGNMGMFVGNQQFTSRNMTFNNCKTAIFMNWNWIWAFKSIYINNCQLGLDMANVPKNQTVGSVLIQDSKFVNTPIGVNSSFTTNSVPVSGGTLVLDNVDFSGSEVAVQSYDGTTVLQGGGAVQNWVSGQTYTGSVASRTIGMMAAPSKPKGLLASNGYIFERSKPQYEQYPASSFVSVKSKGAAGDGVTDDTKAIQAAIDSLQGDQVLYFDHGAYMVRSTINVPGNKNIKITGEIWPLILACGPNFANEKAPQAVFSVGQTGDTGSVEISDIIFETQGPAAGAIMIQWNSNAVTQGANGIWDAHVRIGGSAGTDLQSDKCTKTPKQTTTPNPDCIGAHTLFHATQQASVLLENAWFWVADHELDLSDHNQINIYNGRGVLLESQNPVWLYGTSSEHSVMYQYQLSNATNVYMSIIQTETPYYQTNPAAPAPFTSQSGDPIFDGTNGSNSVANMAWGLRVVDSSDILVYGAGLYSFFDNYNQACVDSQTCQGAMVSVEGNTDGFTMFGVSTKAAENMITTGGSGIVSQPGNKKVTAVSVLDKDNRNGFCATVGRWVPS